ncbi:TPA: J517_1871 family lipoprotein, partial [Acinetobacter baumannii]
FDIHPTPVSNSGYWTGQFDRLVGTLILESDGTGVICQDHLGTARVMSVKLLNDRLYSQDGTYWKISNFTPTSLELNYALGGGYKMIRDNGLKFASPACKDKLNTK